MESLENKVFTVLEINELVREVIKISFPGQLWVRGEIQDYNNKKDKPHVFFNLVQKGDADAILAQVTVVIFESVKAQINRRLRECAGAFELKDGIEVQFLCRTDFYAKSGRYQLVISDIEPAYTLGKAALNRQKIVEDLKARGLLEKNKECALSEAPLRVGLLTSFDSAAYHDFINELALSGYGFKVFLYNCRMQGAETEHDIIRAIQYFNRMDKRELDVVAITRGGGSTADLSFFDNKKIAQEIANSRYPVITALGHEINTTIADLVAHTSLKTPTKAAQFLVEKVKALVQETEYLSGEIIFRAKTLLQSGQDKLKFTGLKIETVLGRYFSDHRQELSRKHQILLSSNQVIALKRKELGFCISKVNPLVRSLLQAQRKRLAHAQEKLQLLDPENILRRGYSITRKNNKVVKNAAGIKEGDILETTLYNGVIMSQATKEKKHE